MSLRLNLEKDRERIKEILKVATDKSLPGSLLLPEAVVELPGQREIIFRSLSADSDRPSAFYRWFKSLRALSLTATASPLILVALWGLSTGLQLQWFIWASALLGVIFLQLATNLWNDVEDHLRLIDLPGRPGGSGVLQKGWLRVTQLQKAAWIFLGLGLACGIPSLILEPKLIAAVAILGALGAIGYSSRPFGMKYRALGDLSVFFLCGPLICLGASYAAFGQFHAWAMVIGCFTGFLACGILHANNLQDIDLDRQSGGYTLASLVGFGPSRHLLSLFYFLAWLCLGSLVLFWEGPQWLLLNVIAGATLTLPLLRKTYKASGTASPALNGLRFEAAKLHLLQCALFGLSLLITLFTQGSAA